jgi:hypothetical protein
MDTIPRVGEALWVAATMDRRWADPNPAMKRIGFGSHVFILKVIHEEPAVLIVDEWGHLQWVTIDSVVVTEARIR